MFAFGFTHVRECVHTQKLKLEVQLTNFFENAQTQQRQLKGEYYRFYQTKVENERDEYKKQNEQYEGVI